MSMNIDERVTQRSSVKDEKCKCGGKLYPVSIRLKENFSARRLPYSFCSKCERFQKSKSMGLTR